MDVPSTIGRYTIEVPLAQGGMARIFLGRATGPGGFSKRVVIKRILPQHADNPAFSAMFLGEARLAALLNHPNVVQVYDFGEEGGSYYLAMEFINGVSGRALLQRSRRLGVPIPPRVAAQLMAMVCSGLHYAHTLRDEEGRALNVIHRDVSPDNLLVTEDGIAKLVDFGVARATSITHQTTEGTVKGKLAYMAPEQVNGAELDCRVDIYAAGVALYELISGKRPFVGTNELELALLVLERTPAPLAELAPGVDPALAAIVTRAMEKQRDLRHPSAAALRDELLTWLGPDAKQATAELCAMVGDALVEQPLPTPSRPSQGAPPPSPESGLATVRAPRPGRRTAWTVILGLLSLASVAGSVVFFSRAAPSAPPIEIAAVPSPEPPPPPAGPPLAPAAEPPPVAPPVAKKRGPQPEGYLTLRSSPWSEVRVDGEPAGTTPLMKLKVAAGNHTVELVNAKFGLRQKLTLNVASGQTVLRVVTVPVGQLQVVAPAGTKVFLGSELLGVTPLAEPLTLIVGRHTLGLVNRADGQQATRIAEVKPGAISEVSLP